MADFATIHHVLDMIDDRIREDERKELIEKYGNGSSATGLKLTPMGHRAITGKAMATVRRVMTRGGTDEELHRALVYLHVCMDALKHKLDYKQCRIDCGIQELDEKYREVKA